MPGVRHLLMIAKVNLIRLATLIWACAVMTVIVSSQTHVINPASLEENAIGEAFFRYQLQQHSAVRRWKVFYLSWGVEASPAPDECVDAFKDYTPNVKRFVISEYDAEAIQKEGGLVLGVSEIKQISAMEAAVEGYSFRLAYEAQGYRCQLGRENGKWLVKSCKGTWIA